LENKKNFFHLHLISDSTGETLIAAGRAAASQFGNSHAVEHVYPLVRNRKQVADVLAEIDSAPGIVLHTVIDRELAGTIDEGCTAMGVPCVSVIEPVLQIFQSYLGAPTRRRVGAQHQLNAGYFARIEALNFTMDHDDGQLPHDLDEADVILLGISRTSKTPTAIYLANRGVKTANVPIVAGMPLPKKLYDATRPLIVCLIASIDHISQVRQNRVLGSSTGYQDVYTDRAAIAEEIKYAKQICARQNWPVIDVTRKSIEETAAAIVALRVKHRQLAGREQPE
jgi:[pyruvate, water dikinase]-phosphate phosphotransferase / [pyruvate, water dikinase] kinase